MIAILTKQSNEVHFVAILAGASAWMANMLAMAAFAALFLLAAASRASAGVVERNAVPGARLLAAVKVVEFPDVAAQPTAAQSQLLSAENNGTALVQQTVRPGALPSLATPLHAGQDHAFLVSLYMVACIVTFRHVYLLSRSTKQSGAESSVALHCARGICVRGCAASNTSEVAW